MNSDNSFPPPIPIKTGKTYNFIPMKDIILCKADASYCLVTCIEKGKITTLTSDNCLGYYAKLLIPKGFIQLHRSHIINPQHIHTLNQTTKTVTLTGNITVQYAEKKTKELLARLHIK